MTKENLKNQIAEAASSFALQIVEAIKTASLQELMELQTSGGAEKPARKKPGPKPGAKKPGPKPKAKKATKAKPGPKKAAPKKAAPKKAKAAPKKAVTKKVKAAPKKAVPKKAKALPKKAVQKAKPAAKATKSITKKTKTKLHDDIVAYLKKNPGSSGGAICKQFDLNPWTARRQMKQLKDAGKIVVKGEKAKTQYSAKK